MIRSADSAAHQTFATRRRVLAFLRPEASDATKAACLSAEGIQVLCSCPNLPLCLCDLWMRCCETQLPSMPPLRLYDTTCPCLCFTISDLESAFLDLQQAAATPGVDLRESAAARGSPLTVCCGSCMRVRVIKISFAYSIVYTWFKACRAGAYSSSHQELSVHVSGFCADREEGPDCRPVSYTHLTLPTTPYV